MVYEETSAEGKKKPLIERGMVLKFRWWPFPISVVQLYSMQKILVVPNCHTPHPLFKVHFMKHAVIPIELTGRVQPCIYSLKAEKTSGYQNLDVRTINNTIDSHRLKHHHRKAYSQTCLFLQLDSYPGNFSKDLFEWDLSIRRSPWETHHLWLNPVFKQGIPVAGAQDHLL